MQLRDYQKEIATKACALLQVYKIAYLTMEVRTGKTITAFAAAGEYGAKSVLFITKKKAISSIKSDFANFKSAFKIHITNYEQLHNLNLENIDLVICDEAHCLGQFPIPAQRTLELKNICRGLPVIYLSGTPTPESYSQIFHQLHTSTYSPFAEYKNFYAWAKDYVDVRKKYVFNRALNDYSHAKQDKIMEKIYPLLLSYTQSEAGFEQEVKEEVIKVTMKGSTYELANKMKNHRVHIGKGGEEIIADTEVKLMQKLHQIYSGTVISETKQQIAFDDYKAQFIKLKFRGKKIAIFYKFQAEFTILQKVFGAAITLSPEEFNNSFGKVFCSQIQSGREGINLSTADALIMYNIDFSSVSYQQAKARIQSKERKKECLLYWIFSEGGIEEKIYQRVINKQDYTLSYFKKDFAVKPLKNIA